MKPTVFERILNVGIAMSTQRDMETLLEMIITEAMEISRCDAGTLYICEEDALHFKIMRNNSLNIFRCGTQIELPPVPMTLENVCSYTVLRGEIVNIEDVYDSKKFNFDGPKRYDKITGYKTQSMLVLPFQNSLGDVIGVLQLLNALDRNKKVISFSEDIITVIKALASQAAIALTNSIYLQNIKNLFHSFVEVMSTAIDELSPYNVYHTNNIVHYVEHFVDYLNVLHEQGKYDKMFDEAHKEALVMSAWLHDVGKLITPLEVMNKPTRLAGQFQGMMDRFDLIYALLRIEFLEGKLTKEAHEEQCNKLESTKNLVIEVEGTLFLEEKTLEKIRAIGGYTYTDLQGNVYPWIKEDEMENLCILRGSLNASERRIMENHVVLTNKLLSKIEFSKDLAQVPEWAGGHHERLDGSGYPFGKKGAQLSTEVRILSILDIYEALVSDARPYKSSMSQPMALQVLEDMAQEGQLDDCLVKLFTDFILESNPSGEAPRAYDFPQTLEDLLQSDK